MTWADYADRALAPLFVVGEPAPDREAVREAYPFGERAYWPYKVWLARVKAWRAAHAAGLAAPVVSRDAAARHVRARNFEDDGATLDLFAAPAPSPESRAGVTL